MSTSNPQLNLFNLKSKDKQILAILILLIILNFSKPLIDFYANIGNFYVSVIQIALALTGYIFFTRNKLIFKTHELIFLSYLIFRFAIEISYGSDIYQPTVSLIKFFLLIAGIRFALSREFSEKIKSKISFCLWTYLLVTSLISILQQQSSYIGNIFTNFGGNYISSNGLDLVRSTGGIGGTVIDYAFFIGLFLILLSSNVEIKTPIKVLIFAIAAFLSFSRIIFAQVFLFLMLKAFTVNRLKYKLPLISAMIIVIISIFFNWAYIVELYLLIASDSDVNRLESWYVIFGNTSVIEILIGKSMGLNTGFPADGLQKVTADSHIIGFISDFGFIGIGIYAIFLFQKISSLNLQASIKYSIIVLLLLPLLANSGFDKFFNIIIFPFFIILLKKNRV